MDIWGVQNQQHLPVVRVRLYHDPTEQHAYSAQAIMEEGMHVVWQACVDVGIAIPA
jgi:hypothetical protein